MIQRMILPVIAVFAFALVAGCGGGDTQQSQPSAEAPPTADVPVMVEETNDY